MSKMLMFGRAAPSYVGVVTNDGGGSSTPSIDVTSLALSEDDVLLVVLGIHGADTSFSMSGFTEVADLHQVDTENCGLHVGYKVQSSTPDTSITIGSAVGQQSCWAAIAFGFSGVNTASVLDTATQTATSSDSLLADPPSITCSARALVVACGAGSDNGSFTSSDLDNFTAHSGENTSFGNGVSIGAGTHVGSINPAAFGGIGDSAIRSWCACTLALSP